MADIYSKAKRVVVWLGPESHDSSTALDCMDILSNKVRVDWNRQELHPTSTEKHWSDKDLALPFDEAQYVSIYTILQRSWFKRLWIWQEVGLASEETLVMIGTRTILWNSVCTTVFCFISKPSPSFDPFAQLIIPVRKLYRLCNQREYRSLPYLVHDTRYSLSSDPRDKIFAVLSLLPPYEREIGIKPDYAKSVAEIYEDVMVRWSQKLRSLRLLSNVEMSKGPDRLPSWVPDWSTARITRPLPGAMASPALSEVTFAFPNGTLETLGVSVARIESIEGFRPLIREHTSLSDIISEMQRITSKIEFHNSLARSERHLSIFCQVISMNKFSDSSIPPMSDMVSRLKGEEVWRECIMCQSAINDEHRAIDIRKFFFNARRFCHNRSLFRTKEGHMGLGPKAAEIGDLVVALLNCGSTMILRPRQDDQYQVVGESYCHGFMDGEAFLGPVPASKQLVWRYDEQLGHYNRAHYDWNTGQLHSEDPRLGQLPCGWTRRSHSREDFIHGS